jgi:hypothetical protein
MTPKMQGPRELTDAELDHVFGGGLHVMQVTIAVHHSMVDVTAPRGWGRVQRQGLRVDLWRK